MQINQPQWNEWSNERNNGNCKHRNENEINRPILPMSMNNLNTWINTTKKINLITLLTEQLKEANKLIYNSTNALNLVLITAGTSLGRHVKKNCTFWWNRVASSPFLFTKDIFLSTNIKKCVLMLQNKY